MRPKGTTHFTLGRYTVLQLLRRHYDRGDEWCTVADLAGTAHGGEYWALRWLVEQGYVEKRRRPKGHKGQPGLEYRITGDGYQMAKRHPTAHHVTHPYSYRYQMKRGEHHDAT